MIRGTVTLTPSFHGAHQWELAPRAGRGATVHVLHRCIAPCEVQLTRAVWRAVAPSTSALRGADTASRQGLDGIRCGLSLEVDGEPLEASVWGMCESLHGALFQLVDRLWEALYAHGPASYRPYLEHVAGYFRAGLPVQSIAPDTLRLYGILTSAQREPMRRVLEALPPGSTVDMSNFEGMGSLLHPLFLAASRHTVARFVVNAAARVALVAAGVAEDRLEATREGPHRKGLRRDVTVTELGSPVRAAACVAKLLRVSVAEARRKLSVLPCWLGAFDAEDLEHVIDMLKTAGIKGQVQGARYRVVGPAPGDQTV